MPKAFGYQEEETFYTILPTATQYSRNAIFAGMLPIDIEKQFPAEWKNDDEEGGKNLFEEEFFKAQLKQLRQRRSEIFLYQSYQSTRMVKNW